MPVLWQVLLPLPPPGIVKTKKRNIQNIQNNTQQRFSRASLCTPAAASLAVRNLMNKPSSPKLQHSCRSLLHSLHLRCPSARSKMSSMLSTIRLKFFRSSHGFSTSLAGNCVFYFFNGKILSTPQSPHAELGDLEIEAFLPALKLSFQRASESGMMQRCTKRASQNAVQK